jgi:RNase H-fold protein (predicted Holliday junction resolvase)
MNYYLNNYDPFDKWVKLYTHNLGLGRPIFILGTSQVGPLNVTDITHYLSLHGKNYNVYDLAISADSPLYRLADLNKIISLKPEVVVYGMGYLDLERKNMQNLSPFGTSQTNQVDILPAPNRLFDKLTLSIAENEFVSKILKDPQFTSWVFLNLVMKRDIRYNYPDISSDTPLYTQSITPPINNIELNEQLSRLPQVFRGIDPIDKNEQALALEKIISTLKKNNIKVVLFTIPYSKSYLNTIPESDKQIFSSIIKEIANKYDVKTYFLDDKYANLKVWNDPLHVAYNENTTVYTDDIENMILDKIEQ